MFVSWRIISRPRSSYISGKSYCLALLSSHHDYSSVGVIIVGNEILKNQTSDTNSAFLIKHVNKLGLKLRRVIKFFPSQFSPHKHFPHQTVVVEDDVEAIAEEARLQSCKYDYVLTAGGLGPTHDDVTYQGIATAMGTELYLNQTLERLCKEHFGQDLAVDSPAMKLAYIPKSSRLVYGINVNTGQRTKFPIVSVRNIYMFPGVPMLLKGAFSCFENELEKIHSKSYLRELFFVLDEITIAPTLNAAVCRFRNDVLFGSYPVYDNNYYKVRITLEANDEEVVELAARFLRQGLPQESIVNFKRDRIRRAEEYVYDFCRTDRRLTETVGIIQQCYEKYGEAGLAISNSGGKDCTLLLHLIFACKKRLFPESTMAINSFYAQESSSFPQVDAFIENSVTRYGLDQVTLQGSKYSVLRQFLDLKPQVKAVFIGSRRTDPGAAHLKYFSTTDKEWPEVVRVSPLLDWSYRDVWQCIRKLFVPYCSLYDRGYTSLGSMQNSSQNPLLKYTDSKGVIRYLPAYELSDTDHERSGRS